MITKTDITSFTAMDDLDNITFYVPKDPFSRFDSYFCQNIITFDIETSNVFVDPITHVGEAFDYSKAIADPDYYKKLVPCSCMYIWQCAVEDWETHEVKVFSGRTWDSFNEFLTRLTAIVRVYACCSLRQIKSIGIEDLIDSNPKIRGTVNMMCGIHNFGFEFQHLNNLYHEDFGYHSKRGRASTFARKPRKPMKSVMSLSGVKIEFRDTYSLTQKGLKSWCEDEDLPVKKLDEPKDYYLKLRTPLSNLTQEDYQYSINDVVCMVYGLDKYRTKYGLIQNIPLTQTGTVRRVCIEEIALKHPEWASLCSDVNSNYTLDFFKTLCHAFAGGWTHGNALYTEKCITSTKKPYTQLMGKITHWDFASSYPNVMTNRLYPRTFFEECDVDEFEQLASVDFTTNDYEYHFIARIHLYNIVSVTENTFWSSSKTIVTTLQGASLDNGKIYACDEVVIEMTGVDWQIFRQAYDIEHYEVEKLWKSKAGYLSETIPTILKYYAYKTTLKQGPDDETPEEKTIRLSKYNESKQFINSIYGVQVYKEFADGVEYGENGWEVIPLDEFSFMQTIVDSNKGMKPLERFSVFQVGVFVTAFARMNLWTIILNIELNNKGTVLYGDTDSLFLLDVPQDVIDEYNARNDKLQEECVAWHKKYLIDLSIDDYCPKTIKGKVKRLGRFEREDDPEEFRYLGAKRYCQVIDGEVEITVAGLPKSSGEKIKDITDFNNHTKWDCKESGKQTAIYNDNQPEFDFTDSEGRSYHCDDRYGVCIMPVPFDMSIAPEYEAFIKWIYAGCQKFDTEIYNDTPAILTEEDY